MADGVHIKPRLTTVLRHYHRRDEITTPLDLSAELLARRRRRTPPEPQQKQEDLKLRKAFASCVVAIGGCDSELILDVFAASSSSSSSSSARGLGTVKRDVEALLGGDGASISRQDWQEIRRLALGILELRGCREVEEEEVEFGDDLPFCNELSEAERREDCIIVGREEAAHLSVVEEGFGEGGGVVEEAVDACWLLWRCGEHAEKQGGSGGLSGPQLAGSVLEALHGSAAAATSEDEAAALLQGPLYDLLGDSGFELMAAVMQHRGVLQFMTAQDLDTVIGQHFSEDGSGYGQPRQPLRRQPQQHQGSRPAIGPSISITSTSEQRELKARRREDRRRQRAEQAARAAGGGDDDGDLVAGGVRGTDWLRQVGFGEEFLAEERSLGLHGDAGAFGPLGDLRDLLPEGTLEYHLPGRRALPSGTERRHLDGYEEVFIPARPRLDGGAGDSNRVPVTELEEWAQTAFRGMTHFNRMQSEVFHAAWRTYENLLVCAPTGAGKTNVAMLTLLREARRHIDAHGVLRRDDMKAVYVAPMKALAQEVVSKFSQRLKALGLKVRECTGDMQLTRWEIDDTQLIVTTPEKWDVITRKGGDGTLQQRVGLVIIDEVHLLADERGAVIESIVSRNHRLQESTQNMCRLVGLSATLPNYTDVALFLRVHPENGLFHFPDEYRPVPLEQTFIGVTDKNRFRAMNKMNEIAYLKALESVRQGNQVLIFTHSRKDTSMTARAIREIAAKHGTVDEFSCCEEPAFRNHSRDVAKSRNRDLKELFESGFGCHHAGMLRPDRSLTERLFGSGAVKVLCCTATLAWGVNLPAHTVVIKGTDVYNSEKGGNSDLSMLDVMQIFGRAGRPQFDTSGEAILITGREALPRYLAKLSHQAPIESAFIKQLPDHLNAEIVAGSVTTVSEAVAWLGYTYLYVRMLMNPMAYGITYEEKANDPMLDAKRVQLIREAARGLDDHRMVRFVDRPGTHVSNDQRLLAPTAVGRIASHLYIRHESMATFQRMLQPHLNDADLVHLVCHSQEFQNLKSRPEETKELEELRSKYCPLDVRGSLDEPIGKANVLLQANISQARITGFTLVSDNNYVSQNAGRVTRALYEMALRKNFSTLAQRLLALCKSVDRKVWWFQSPLRQFSAGMSLPYEVIGKLEQRRCPLSALVDMTAAEIGQLCRHNRIGEKVLMLASQVPRLEMEAKIQPITHGVLRLTVTVTSAFDWSDRVHHGVEPFVIWVEDGENERIYHQEAFLLKKKTCYEPHVLAFTVPIFEPVPAQYIVRAMSDRWVSEDSVLPVSFQHMVLPERGQRHTDLQNLHPLPVTALRNKAYETLYSGKFTHFNPIQTQVFHVCYHTPHNVLLGAPTGSGKTVIAELCILKMFSDAVSLPARREGTDEEEGGGEEKPSKSKSKLKPIAVYVAPLKALARERLKDWRNKLGGALGRNVLELTGDVTPDGRALATADVLITTPEKWDGVSRNWRRRDYVARVALVIIDEIHLLGEDRGPVLEVIVSRMRYISERTGNPVRFVGLSTALANPRDLGDWLGIPESGAGLYNFRPSLRPVPMDVHIQGFPGKHYCPRMATMNKPTYMAIMEHSPNHPALVFVASRRQTRLTALALISFCAAAENPKQFLRMSEEAVEAIASNVRDSALRHTLVFGIGLHHAGLSNGDRTVVEELFCTGQIQVLVCTSTLAWGVNFPARLVVVKGTEFFDGKKGGYVDFPVTDVLQMMGRAGRPGYDDKGCAVILVHEPKKNFFKKFLYEPFPVESKLTQPGVLHNHLAAEIAGGSIASTRDAVEYLTWTYFFRRLLMNPTFYQLDDSTDEAAVQQFLLDFIGGCLADLVHSGVIEMDTGGGEELGSGDLVTSTTLGPIASYYYLDHKTVGNVQKAVIDLDSRSEAARGKLNLAAELLAVVCGVTEYDEIPVRHNEELLNADLLEKDALPWRDVVDRDTLDDAHTKALILLLAHLTHGSVALPISDYVNDTKTVLDQVLRILNASVDIAANEGLLEPTVALMRLSQMITQGRVIDGARCGVVEGETVNEEDSTVSLLQIPRISEADATSMRRQFGPNFCLKELVRSASGRSSREAERNLSLALSRDDQGTAGRGRGRGRGHGRGRGRGRGRGGRGGGGDDADAAWSAVRALPSVDLHCELRTTKGGEPASSSSPLSVAPGEALKVSIRLSLLNPSTYRRRVHAPSFHKQRDHGWWAIVADETNGELLALKRLPILRGGRGGAALQSALEFEAPEECGPWTPAVLLISDSVMGLDRRVDLSCSVVR